MPYTIFSSGVIGSPIELLRNNPQTCLHSNSYYVDFENKNSTIGGCIQISKVIKNKYCIKLLATETGEQDYQFPYLHNSAGSVKISNPQCGTIVVTGGMNGCALEVRYHDGAYYFYHDANGVNMIPIVGSEIQVCRISASHYWDVSNITGYMHSVPGYRLNPIIQFICVYRNGMWHVGSTGILLGTDGVRAQDVMGTFVPLGGKYRGFFDDKFYLIQN